MIQEQPKEITKSFRLTESESYELAAIQRKFLQPSESEMLRQLIHIAFMSKSNNINKLKIYD